MSDDFRGIDVSGGVTSAWLAAAFGMTQQSVRNKLAHCRSRTVKGRGVMYHFTEAVQFLVPHSAQSIAEFLEDTDPEDMPLAFQKEFWATEKVRMAVQKESGELWATQDVVESLSDLLQRLKAAIQLFPDRVHRAHGLTGAQRTTIVGLCDELLDDVHKRVRAMADEKTTGSQYDHVARKLNGRADPVEDII